MIDDDSEFSKTVQGPQSTNIRSTISLKKDKCKEIQTKAHHSKLGKNEK